MQHLLKLRSFSQAIRPQWRTRQCRFAIQITGVVGFTTCLACVSSRNRAYCAALQKADEALPIKLSSEDTVLLPESSSWLDSLTWFLSLLYRSGELLWAYTPAFLTVPLLLMNNTEQTDLWLRILRHCIRKSGPCHIKFAQWIATRPDLFPLHVCECFADLQSTLQDNSGTGLSLEELKRMLKLEYGPSWEEIIRLETTCHDDMTESPVALGGGCVAQVYKGKAVLREQLQGDDGALIPVWREIAIKVTHPNVKRRIVADLELMLALARGVEYLFPSLRNIALVDSVEEFIPIMIQQVDMQHEAINLLRFRKHFHNLDEFTTSEQIHQFIAKFDLSNTNTHRSQQLYQGFQKVNRNDDASEKDDSSINQNHAKGKVLERIVYWLKGKTAAVINHPWFDQILERHFLKNISEDYDIYHVYFPEPILSLTTENVLIETCETGVLMRDFLQGNCTDREKKWIAKFGLSAVLKMVFIDNFVHADLHPGNIIVMKRESTKGENGFRLCFIDCGIVGTLSTNDQRNLVDLFDAVIKNQGYRVGQLMIERSRFPDSISPENRQCFAMAMDKLVKDVHKTGLKSSKIDINQLLSNVLSLCYQYQVKLESRYAIIILAMGIVEGLGRKVDPDIDLMTSAAPFVLKASIRHFSHLNSD